MTYNYDDVSKWACLHFNNVPIDLLADSNGEHDWEEWERLNPPTCDNVGSCDGCEECEEHLHAFPFAWGTAFLPDFSVHPDDATKAGFLLYEFRDELVLGIDGGGYDFYEQHWMPLMKLTRARAYGGIEND